MADVCATEQWRLSAYLDGELTDAQATAITAHANTCDGCFGELQRLGEARSRLRQLAQSPGSIDLFAGIEELERRRLRRLRRFAAISIGSGATMMALSVVAALTEPAPPTIRPPVEVFVVDHVARTGGGPILTPVDLGR